MTIDPVHSDWLGRGLSEANVLELRRGLVDDRVLFHLGQPDDLESLRGDAARIAAGMERGEGRPPMLWSGIPFPSRPPVLRSDYCLVVSVGGTKTEHALLRLEDGEVRILDRAGREARGADVARVKASLRFPTPTHRETADGFEMIERITEAIADYLRPHIPRLEKCPGILLSWGFAHRAVRTGPRVLGGLSALTTLMTKEQAPFTTELRGKDLGELFRASLERRLAWSRPVTVANDGVMALHYFLTAENLARHAAFGLFINGTGTNFAASEPYAVRHEGVVSAAGDAYEPERLTRFRSLREGERREDYFVNYETGSIDLAATRSAYDFPTDYPIEENALSGGRAFEHQFREIIRARVSTELYDRLTAGRDASPPRGPEVSRLAERGPGAAESVFPGARVSPGERERLCFAARAVVARSALHAALILAAVTARTGFGLGDEVSSKPDLLALEGSVWSIPDYPDLVRGFWSALVAPRPLHAAFAHEKGFNASLPGPLHLAVVHR